MSAAGCAQCSGMQSRRCTQTHAVGNHTAPRVGGRRMAGSTLARGCAAASWAMSHVAVAPSTNEGCASLCKGYWLENNPFAATFTKGSESAGCARSHAAEQLEVREMRERRERSLRSRWRRRTYQRIEAEPQKKTPATRLWRVRLTWPELRRRLLAVPAAAKLVARLRVVHADMCWCWLEAGACRRRRPRAAAPAAGGRRRNVRRAGSMATPEFDRMVLAYVHTSVMAGRYN
ncbi:hypothetical protein AXF42_Ash014174 [Apostasia shenzhenica]|uniref:Uncharacterized protein n=1 Tax=Apostasia shenzhenica TaxID=1088818 RepID=A0A2I0A152_9ASPA|nr:hypothetical protein AXF42_Ash014174 [Apostasia shenzhenica]